MEILDVLDAINYSDTIWDTVRMQAQFVKQNLMYICDRQVLGGCMYIDSIEYAQLSKEYFVNEK